MSSNSVSVGFITRPEGKVEVCLTVSNEDRTTHTGLSPNLARVLANTMLDIANMLEDQPQPAKEE